MAARPCRRSRTVYQATPVPRKVNVALAPSTSLLRRLPPEAREASTDPQAISASGSATTSPPKPKASITTCVAVALLDPLPSTRMTIVWGPRASPSNPRATRKAGRDANWSKLPSRTPPIDNRPPPVRDGRAVLLDLARGPEGHRARGRRVAAPVDNQDGRPERVHVRLVGLPEDERCHRLRGDAPDVPGGAVDLPALARQAGESGVERRTRARHPHEDVAGRDLMHHLVERDRQRLGYPA